jgi:hypothetical protein
MVSTYVNNLRLEEMESGANSGTWGTKTNVNLELVGQALGYGTRAIANASTDNITIADGVSDADRSMYLKLTGGGQACTITLLPNTSSKMWVMENATSAALTFTQGTGANVVIAAGQTKMIFADGLGSGAVVHELGALTLNGDVTTAGTFNALGDTSAGDNAAIGYTTAEGLILTGQGSTSDITLKNDADAVVFTVPTGTDDILFPDDAKALWGAGSDLQIYHNGTNSIVGDFGTGDLLIYGTDDVFIRGSSTSNYMARFAEEGAVSLYYDNAAKFSTTTGGVDVTGTIVGDGLTLTTGATVTTVLDEDDMASNSATSLATQQSIKAYVDAHTSPQSWSGILLLPADQTYKLVIKCPFAGVINSVTTMCASGSATATFKINTTALGGTANAISTSEQSQAHSGTNAFSVGDDIQVTISSNSSCVDASFTIEYTR